MKVAIINKDYVVVGPLSWDYSFLLNNLKPLGIQQDIPIFQPSSELLPIIFNSDTKLVEVQEIIPEHDDLTEFLTGPDWDVSGNVAVATYGKKEYPISYLIELKKREVTLNRYNKEQLGKVVVNFNNTDYSVSTSRENKSQLIDLYNLIGDDQQYNVKLNISSFVQLNKQQIKSILDAINDFVQDRFDWELQTFSQIEACQTVEELRNISSSE